MLDRFGDFQVIRKRQAKRYLDSLMEIKGIILPEGVLKVDHNAHLFVIQTERQEELRIFLRSKGIGTAIHYPKILSEMGIFESIGEFPKAKKNSCKWAFSPLESISLRVGTRIYN
jgi:UDP-2-acetamido-2-deoxy-ribo-hexuluronate aminotransferase